MRTVWALARMAACADPDSATSPGGLWLRSVEEETLEAIVWRREHDEDFTLAGFVHNGGAHELADGAVPVYSGHLWAVFVDLAAWQEDPSDLAEPGDMEQAAKAGLYLIAERLVSAVISEHGGRERSRA